MAKNSPRQSLLKKWITGLLFASCIAVGLLHIREVPDEHYYLTHSSRLDSLITATFDESGIPAEQVGIRQIVIDSLVTRRVFTAELPPGHSPTLWHIRLNEKVQPYGLQTPAKVDFPDMDLRIHLTYDSNVIRSVILQVTDETEQL